MSNYIDKVNSLELLRVLFDMMDEHHQKQLVEKKDYHAKSDREHTEYIATAQKSMDDMGEDYNYHNYDFGIDRELAYETLAAESEFDYYSEISELQLLSMYEMKILYLYKEIEIRLKTIISVEFQKSTKNLSNLRSIEEYFSKKDVILTNIECYDKVDELRNVANDLKHSIKINKSKNISEFKGISEFNLTSLQKFMSCKVYEVEKFLMAVTKAVNKDLGDPFIPIEEGIPF